MKEGRERQSLLYENLAGFMNSLKKQILWTVLGTAIATILFGVVLSLFVNLGLRQLEEQPDFLPTSPTAPSGSDRAPL